MINTKILKKSLKKSFLTALVLVIFFCVCFQYTPEEEVLIKKDMERLYCIDCKSIFRYEDEIKFKIGYKGERNLYVYFGIRIKIDDSWKILAFDNREADSGHKIASYTIRPGETKVIKWNKDVIFPMEVVKKHNLVMNKDDVIAIYDIRKGCELMLFSWKISALSHGIHKDLQRFVLLPQETKQTAD